jgi:amino acid transporter
MAPVEGIFIVLVIVAGAMGTLTPWAFMLGAIGIALTGWNVAQLARRIPSAGSYVGFAYHGAGAIRPKLAKPAAAFTFYLSLAAGPITVAAVVVFLGSRLQTAASLPNVRWLVISLAAIALTSPVILRGISAGQGVLAVDLRLGPRRPAAAAAGAVLGPDRRTGRRGGAVGDDYRRGCA